MVLIGKVESEVEIQAPAAKVYNVFRKQLEQIPNISTLIIGAKVHKGDWENVGSVKHWEFTIETVFRIESIDMQALGGKVQSEVEIQAPVDKLYNFFRKQLEQIPNISTHIIGAKVHKGDWENVGSVKHWEFTIDGKILSAKIKIESIDDDNKVITYNAFDGDVSEDYKNLKVIIQVIEKENGGGIAKWTYEYEKLKEDITGVSPDSYLNAAIKMTKEIDAHLLKN